MQIDKKGANDKSKALALELDACRARVKDLAATIQAQDKELCGLKAVLESKTNGTETSQTIDSNAVQQNGESNDMELELYRSRAQDLAVALKARDKELQTLRTGLRDKSTGPHPQARTCTNIAADNCVVS